MLNEWKQVSLYGMKEKVSIRKIGVDIGFCVTAHKVQGRTIKKIVLHISSAMALTGILVALSRVEYEFDIRLFPVDDWGPVFKKTWDKDLKEFLLKKGIH